MIAGGVTYCNVCSAEITAGEPDNAFTTDLLAKTGHCHSECLAQRNQVVDAFNTQVRVLASMLDPGCPSHPKLMQSAAIEQARGVALKRTTEPDRPKPVQALERQTLAKAAAKKPAAKKAAAKKKVKRAT